VLTPPPAAHYCCDVFFSVTPDRTTEQDADDLVPSS
jgi:hypothetical protein